MSKATIRPWNASKEINDLELKWWEDNAEIVSKVWELPDPLSLAFRGNYLRKAKEFFLNNRSSSLVLDLGCGSGWVGQFIADNNLRIVGTDFSHNQIELAKQNAHRRGVSGWCEYTVQTDKDTPPRINEVNGILLHCFLHHLDGAEIDALLARLATQAKPGTKFFIHEPAFYLQQPSNHVPENPLSVAYHEVATKLHQCLTDSLNANQFIDLVTKNRFNTLAEEAEKNNWYLSPKELPFDVIDFTNTLSKYFKVSSHYWSNIYIVGWIYELSLITEPNVQKIAHNGVLPILTAIDDFLSRDEGFLRRMLVPPGYAFHVWECEL